MRFSLIRSGAVALAASFAMSACAGHGIVPSATSYAPSASSDDVARSTTPPCLAKTLPWKFKGAFAIANLSSKASKSTLPKYKGFTISTSYNAGSVIGSGKVLFCDATGVGDITGLYKGKKFPLYKGTDGTGALYVEAVNLGTSSIGLHTTPQIVIGGLKAGKTCYLVLLEKTGWFSPGISEKVVAGKVTYKSLPNAVNFGFPAGQPVFLGIACK